jgi:uncharacterized membrane protein
MAQATARTSSDEVGRFRLTGPRTGSRGVASEQAATASPDSTTQTQGGAAMRFPRPLLRLLAAPLTALAVLSQVLYPLVDGDPSAASNPTLVAVTTVSVCLFCSASVVHAAAAAGSRAALLLVAIAGGTGLLAESIGVATGFPFGRYHYTGTLGPAVLGVPVLVPLAWVMMAYPCLLAGRTVATQLASRHGRPHHGRRPNLEHVVTVAASAWLLAAWDLFLDPQMVHAGHWRWAHPDPGLPGLEGVPLSNFLGWLLVAIVLQAALHLAFPRVGDADGREHAANRRLPAVPAVLLAWTWLGSALANLAFFGRPAVALYGLLAMGVVAAPALFGWVRR